MARQPQKLNTPVSATGQVGNRAAYMRPGRENSGSQALASALNSISGSLSEANRQVDRYQNAQRQSELEAARKAQNEEVARLQVQGIRDAEQGQSSRGSFMADSPIFQAAYQEAHMGAAMSKRMTEEEAGRDWSAYSNDVENGHNRLQSDLLDLGEDIMAGYSPEVQAQFYPRYREWAAGKMRAQAEGAKATRLKNIGEDGVTTIESMLVTGASIDEITATIEEINNLAAAGGATEPSSVGANALLVAAELNSNIPVLQEAMANKEFMKTLSSSQRQAMSDKLDAMVNEERRESAYNESQRNKALGKAKGQAYVGMVQAFAENPDGGVEIYKGFQSQMMALAQEDPSRATQYLGLAQQTKNMLIPDPEEADPFGDDLFARARVEQEAASMIRAIAYAGDEATPEMADVMNTLLARVHPDDRSRLLGEYRKAATDDHPDLALPASKEAQGELRIVASQAQEVMKVVGAKGTMFSPNAMGVSTFGATMADEYAKAIRSGATIQDAKRMAFGAAASQTQLYNKIAEGLDDGTEMSNYINGIASVPGLEDLMFNNPHYTRWSANNKERIAKLQQEQVQMQSNLKGLTLRSGDTTEE